MPFRLRSAEALLAAHDLPALRSLTEYMQAEPDASDRKRLDALLLLRTLAAHV